MSDYGLQHRAVQWLLGKAERLTPDEVSRMVLVHDRRWADAWRAAADWAVWAGRRDAESAAWDGAWDATRGRTEARRGALSAVQAVVVADLIADGDYRVLAGPFEAVAGPVPAELWAVVDNSGVPPLPTPDGDQPVAPRVVDVHLPEQPDLFEEAS